MPFGNTDDRKFGARPLQCQCVTENIEARRHNEPSHHDRPSVAEPAPDRSSPTKATPLGTNADTGCAADDATAGTNGTTQNTKSLPITASASGPRSAPGNSASPRSQRIADARYHHPLRSTVPHQRYRRGVHEIALSTALQRHIGALDEPGGPALWAKADRSQRPDTSGCASGPVASFSNLSTPWLRSVHC